MSTPIVEITPPTIERNGIKLQLAKAVFSPKSDDHKGKTFFTPELSLPTLDTLETKNADGSVTRANILRNVEPLVWFGLDQVIGSCNKVARGVFGGIAARNYVKNNGVFNMTEFIEEAADFTAARESLANIQEELDDLTALQASYTLNDAFAESIISGEWTPEARELQAKAKENAIKINALRAKRESIENEYARRAEVRKATEAKKAAAAGLQKETVPA